MKKRKKNSHNLPWGLLELSDFCHIVVKFEVVVY